MCVNDSVANVWEISFSGSSYLIHNHNQCAYYTVLFWHDDYDYSDAIIISHSFFRNYSVVQKFLRTSNTCRHTYVFFGWQLNLIEGFFTYRGPWGHSNKLIFCVWSEFFDNRSGPWRHALHQSVNCPPYLDYRQRPRYRTGERHSAELKTRHNVQWEFPPTHGEQYEYLAAWIVWLWQNFCTALYSTIGPQLLFHINTPKITGCIMQRCTCFSLASLMHYGTPIMLVTVVYYYRIIHHYINS